MANQGLTLARYLGSRDKTYEPEIEFQIKSILALHQQVLSMQPAVVKLEPTTFDLVEDRDFS
jgi:hypothetical protein